MTDDRKSLAPGLEGRGDVLRFCPTSEAESLLVSPGLALDGVVWDMRRSRPPQGARLSAAIRTRPDLVFVVLAGRSSGARRPRGVRCVLTLPLTTAQIVDTVRREAHVMDLERQLEAARGVTRSQRRRLTVLSDISKAANSVLEPRKVMEIVMSRAQGLIRAEAWSLLLVDEKEASLSSEMVMGSREDRLRSYSLKIGQGIAGWVVQHKRPVIVNDVKLDRRFDPGLDIVTGRRTRSILCVPLLSRGRIIGAAELINKRRGGFTREDLNMVTTLVEPGAIALENAMLYQRSAELTVTDDLTKLYNSRYLNVYLGREIKRSRRYGASVSLIFLDLDGFKRINDSHGHLAGSRALYEVGRVIQETVREVDVVSRYGGDEFTVILPQTDTSGAMIIAERIRAMLETEIFLTSLGIEAKLTASLGVSTFPDHGKTREELIQRADQAMYAAKDAGKNSVFLAQQGALIRKGTLP